MCSSYHVYRALSTPYKDQLVGIIFSSKVAHLLRVSDVATAGLCVEQLQLGRLRPRSEEILQGFVVDLEHLNLDRVLGLQAQQE